MATEIDVDAFVEFEATGFDRVAAEYERRFGELTGRVAEPLLDAAGVRGGERVLDVATGPGQVAARAAARGAAVVGLDVSSGVLEVARRRHPDLDFRQGDAHRLPLADASFDVVVANFLLPHLADHARGVAEMVRVLVDGGRLALSTWDLPGRSPMPGVLFLAVQEVGAPAVEDVPPGPPFFHYSEDVHLTALLSDAGLVDVAVADVTFTWHAPSADALWESLLGGTVRASAQVRGQPDAMRRRIREAFDAIVDGYRAPGTATLDLPVAVKIGSGRKPGVSRP